MRRKRILLFLIGVVVIGVALGFALRTPQPTAVLPDGTVLQITGVKVGYTNEFKHGSRLEKILGGWIPTNGWKVGRWRLERPEVVREGQGTNSTTLTVQLQLTGASESVNGSEFTQALGDFEWDFRVVHYGEDEVRYVGWLNGFSVERRDGYFKYIDLTTYARGSENLYLELQRRAVKEEEWKTIARLEFENPAPTEAQSWRTESYPVTNTYGDFSAVLGEVRVQELADDANFKYELYVTFNFFLNGQSVTNWTAERMELYDASGNYDGLITQTIRTNVWTTMRALGMANPHVPWRVVGHFTEVSGFEDSNIFRVVVPASSKEIMTNVLGLPVGISRNESSVLIRIPEGTAGRRIVLLDISGLEGNSLAKSILWLDQWHARAYGKNFNSWQDQEVTVIGAIVRDIPFEFTVQPKLVREFELPGEE